MANRSEILLQILNERTLEQKLTTARKFFKNVKVIGKSILVDFSNRIPKGKFLDGEDRQDIHYDLLELRKRISASDFKYNSTRTSAEFVFE